MSKILFQALSQSLILSSLVFFNQSASADIPLPPAPSPVKIEQAQLDANSIDFRLLQPYSFAGARVSVQYGLNDAGGMQPEALKLVIFRERKCAADRPCPRDMPAPIQVELKVTEVGTGFCGATVITAREDGRPIDGELKELVITDYRTLLCRMVMPNPTQVTYRTAYNDRRLGMEITTFSFLEGGALKDLVVYRR